MPVLHSGAMLHAEHVARHQHACTAHRAPPEHHAPVRLHAQLWQGTSSKCMVRQLQPCHATASAPSRPASKSNQANEVFKLLQETAQLAVSTAPHNVFRAAHAASVLASLAGDYVKTGGTEAPQVLLRKAFEQLGATYIKLGQLIASSPSVFPDEYVEEFQKCLDQAQPVPFQAIRATIEQELRKPIEAVFESVDPQPLASASIAQVHAGVLRGSRQRVVLKVLKPGVRAQLETDMAAVYLAARYLELLQPQMRRLSITDIARDIRESMLQEVDFEQEAKHIRQFSAFLDSRGLRSVATCPHVYGHLSSKRLIVMERLQGVPLTDYEAIRRMTDKDPESVLVSALNTWLASLLGAETFHADVHAGNLLVLRDGRVAFLDFGIVGRISPATWAGCEALVRSLALSDYGTMARALATIGACDADVDFVRFSRDLEALFTELEAVSTAVVVEGSARGPGVSAALEVDRTQLTRLLTAVVRVGEDHGIKFPREFGLLMKQLLYFDRYARLLAPSLRVFNDDRIRLRDLSHKY